MYKLRQRGGVSGGGPADLVEGGLGLGQPVGELLDLVLQLEDALDAGEVDAPALGELLDQPDALDVAVGVAARAAGCPRRLEQTLALIRPQGLGMHASQLRGHRDDVDPVTRHDARPRRSLGAPSQKYGPIREHLHPAQASALCDRTYVPEHLALTPGGR